jgi:flagellar motor switch protein FliM
MCWWTPEQLMKMADYLQSGLQRWSESWVTDAARVSVTGSLAHEAIVSVIDREIAIGLLADTAAEGQIWCIADDPIAQMSALLFGDSESEKHAPSSTMTRLSLEVCNAAMDSLRYESVQCLSPHSPHVQIGKAIAAIPSAYLKPWSGAVQFRVELAKLQMRLYLGPVCVTQLLDRLQTSEHGQAIDSNTLRRSRLVPVFEALALLPSGLRAELEAIELELCSLEALREGDVILLSHRLDMPVDVVTANGGRVCQGHLGRQQSRRALQLIPSQYAQPASNDQLQSVKRIH